MNNFDPIKHLKDVRDLMNSQECKSTRLIIWSRKEGRLVEIETQAEAIEHSTVAIKPKLKDLFAGLK